MTFETRPSSTSHPNTWHKSRYGSRSAIYRSSGSEPPAANSQLRGYDRLSGPTRSSSGERATASQITELLGLLPLLLEQAGAYIRETRLSLVGHLERLQRYLALTVAKGGHAPAPTPWPPPGRSPWNGCSPPGRGQHF
jgi:hypothetical protein